MQSRWKRLQPPSAGTGTGRRAMAAPRPRALPRIRSCPRPHNQQGTAVSWGGHRSRARTPLSRSPHTPTSCHSPGLTTPGRTPGMCPWSGAGCCAKPTYGSCWGVPAPGWHSQHPSVFWDSGGSAGAGWGCSARSAHRRAEAGRVLQQRQPLARVRAGWEQHLQGARLSWGWAPRHTRGRRSPLVQAHEQLRPW